MTPHDRIAMSVIDKWLRYRIDHSDLPGMQICIRKDGGILLNAAYGKANLETGEAFRTDHLTRIASHSKMFASCCILMLVIDGKLRLDSKMVDILTELKAHKDARVGEITIRDLLSNRSGLFRDGVESEYWSLDQPPFADYAKLIEDVLAANLVYEPNTKTKYSNWGFGLIGLIVERVSGQSFSDFATQRILAKLPGAAILPDWHPGTDKPFATGYSKQDENGKRWPLKHKTTNGMAAATGFCATMEGISLFLHTLLFTDTLLPREWRDELLHLNWPAVDSKTERYGLGILFDQLDDFAFVGHSGGFQGFTSATRNWVGGGYIISLIFNTHEPPVGPLKAVTEVIDRITKIFDKDTISKVVVSEPMINRWGAAIYAVGEKKALGFTADSWTPCFAQPVLERKDGDGYIADKSYGYGNIGEAVVFDRGPNGQITGMRHGSGRYWPEAEFLELAKDTVDS